jgi:hypothetical protein
METQNLNATLDCIKETTTFTQRIITNVCTGDVSTIPIGFWDFALGGFVGLLLFGVILMFVLMIWDIVKR